MTEANNGPSAIDGPVPDEGPIIEDDDQPDYTDSLKLIISPPDSRRCPCLVG